MVGHNTAPFGAQAAIKRNHKRTIYPSHSCSPPHPHRPELRLSSTGAETVAPLYEERCLAWILRRGAVVQQRALVETEKTNANLSRNTSTTTGAQRDLQTGARVTVVAVQTPWLSSTS